MLTVDAIEHAVAQLPAEELAKFRRWLGSERFKEQIETLGQRRATSKGVGRPKKEKNRV